MATMMFFMVAVVAAVVVMVLLVVLVFPEVCRALFELVFIHIDLCSPWTFTSCLHRRLAACPAMF